MKIFPVLLVLWSLAACGMEEPPAKSGVLDLRSRVALIKDGALRLNGEWEFYWKAFPVEPDKTNAAKFIVSVPRSWTQYTLDDNKLGAAGFATYRLRVLLDQPLDNMALTGIVSSAHRMYVNGRLVLAVGRTAKTPANFRAHFHKPVSRPFRLEKVNDIVIHAANFAYYQGGIIQSPELGSHEALTTRRRNRQWTTLLLVGSILFMAIYHVFLFALNPGERSALYFTALCLAVSTRMVLVNERVAHDLIPDMPFQIYTRLIFLATYGILLGFAFFMDNLFEDNINQAFSAVIKVGTLIIMAAVVFLPLEVSPHTLPAFGALFAAGTVYAVYVLARSVRTGSATAVILMLGLSCVFAAGVNDLFYSLHIINTGYVTQYAFAVLVLGQSFMVSSRMLRQLRTSNERLLSLDKLKDDFLANTSHELRTPLQGIIGLADSLMDPARDTSNSSAARRVELIKESARRLSRLVNDILDFSKLRNHDILLGAAAVDLRSLVNVQLELIAYAVPGNHKVKLINAVPEDLPSAMGDAGRITQILHNLLSNAVKHTSEGEIRVRARVADEQASMLEIRVSDTGTGIPRAASEKIFEPFEQVMENAKGSRGGTGLGLSIARSLAELHGGKLLLENSSSAGTTFLFTLPAADTRARKETADQSANAAAIAGIQNFTPVHRSIAQEESRRIQSRSDGDTFVLLVDDEPVNLEVMQSYTEMAGIRSASAENADEARRFMAEQDTPDCLVLDIMMPGISGLEFTRELRKTYSMTQLPILLVTARTRTGDLMAGMEAGANDYLAKPFEKEEFLLRVGSLTSLARTHRDADQSRVAAREVAQRVRADINADLHDHLGASLTDLQLLSEAALNDASVNRGFAEKMNNLVTRTALLLRSDLLTLEDMDLLEQDFSEGIHLILLRRYVEADREIEFSAHGVPERLPIDDVRSTVLYAVITEMTTNDLKYGAGSPVWSFEWNAEELNIKFQSLTHYRMESHGTGQGTGTVVRRLADLGGTFQMSLDTSREDAEARAIRMAIHVPLRPRASLIS